MVDSDAPYFAVSAEPPPPTSTLFVALLQQISSRSSIRDLECILQRFGLRDSERLLVVLDCTATCPKSLKKAATRLCARHAVFYYSAERPLCAVAHALAGIELETMDFVLVVRNVLPDADIIDRVVDAVAGSDTIQLFRLVPPSSVGFAARADLLQLFCEENPLMAAHQDADVILQCACVGNSGNDSMCTLMRDDGYYHAQPLKGYHEPICEGDARLLEKTASQLSLHVSDRARPTLQQLIAETRARLRRAVAAHWRSVTSAEEEEEALDAILFSRHLGIIDFCKRAEAPSLPCCVTGAVVHMGIRVFSEELGIHSDPDRRFRLRFLRAFPTLLDRMQLVSTRATKALVSSAFSVERSDISASESSAPSLSDSVQ